MTELIITYFVGIALILVFAWFALANEPTAHGQIIGCQFAMAIAVLWPLALPYFLLVTLFVTIRAAWRGLQTGKWVWPWNE